MDENHVRKMQLAITILLEEPDDLNSALETELRLFRDKLHVLELEHAIGLPGALAYRAGTSGPVSEEPSPACAPVPRAASLVRMTMHWSDGTVTTVCPPTPPVA
jgi:hypothetical protein